MHRCIRSRSLLTIAVLLVLYNMLSVNIDITRIRSANSSLGNLVILSTTVDFRWKTAHTIFLGEYGRQLGFKCVSVNGNGFESETETREATNKQPACLWTTHFTVCNISTNISQLYLENANSARLRLSLSHEASREPLDLVVCMTPFYYFERWALLAFAVEAWQSIGASRIEIYLQSMTAEAYMLLRAYEQEGRVKVKLWPKLPRFGSFDPNKEVKWRGEMAALGDCLNFYRYSAKFLFFGSPDEIVFPNKAHGSLLNELSLLTNRFPKVSVFRYRPQIASVSSQFLAIPIKQLDFHFLFQNATVTGFRTGKFVKATKYFVKGNSTKVLGTDIHRPIFDDGRLIAERGEIVAGHFNRFSHFHISNKQNGFTTSKKLQGTLLRDSYDFLSTEGIEQLKQSYLSMLAKNDLASDDLTPPEEYYSADISACVEFLKEQLTICHTHFSCSFGPVKIRCFNAIGFYSTQVLDDCLAATLENSHVEEAVGCV